MAMPNLELSRQGALETMCIMVAKECKCLGSGGIAIRRGTSRRAGSLVMVMPGEAQEQPHRRLQTCRLASQYTTVTCSRSRQQMLNYNLRAHPRRPACGGSRHEMIRGACGRRDDKDGSHELGCSCLLNGPCAISAPSLSQYLQKRRGSSSLALPRVYVHPHPPSLLPAALLRPLYTSPLWSPLSHSPSLRRSCGICPLISRHSLILGVLASLYPHSRGSLPTYQSATSPRILYAPARDLPTAGPASAC